MNYLGKTEKFHLIRLGKTEKSYICKKDYYAQEKD
jgi:hypothetical protein